MHFGLAELIQVPQELQDVISAAAREGERRSVILEVLSERVPVPPLLRLVAARCSSRLRLLGHLLLHIVVGVVQLHLISSGSRSAPASRRPHSISEGAQRVITQHE